MNDNQGKLYALLIGVDYYAPIPNWRSLHLYGCVRDVTAMDRFLKARLGMGDEAIVKLTASHDGQGGVVEAAEHQPTYHNIATAFNHFRETLGAGDHLLIHYSGHGGRAKTIYPDLKGENGIDEGFIPTDLGADGRYFRDVEFAKALHDMAENGVTLSVFLDCCHAAGMMRGVAVARGVNGVDRTARPTDSLIGDAAGLTETWRELTGAGAATRGSVVGLPETKKWVVLAACRPQQRAYEYRFDGENKSGALTHFTLDILESAVGQMSYHQLYQHVMSRVNAQFNQQMPQLYGDRARTVFGTERIDPALAVTVMNVEDEIVTLRCGVAQGVQEGAEFAVFPLDAADLTDFGQAITVRISDAGTEKCLGRVVEGGRIEQIAIGANAVWLTPGEHTVIRHVRMQQGDEIDALSDEAVAAITAAHTANKERGFIRFIGRDVGERIEFIVAHDPDNKGHYVICDASGAPLPRITPTVAIGGDGAAETIVKRLIHLTKYHNVRDLTSDNASANHHLKARFAWKNHPIGSSFDPDKSEPVLEIRNVSDRDLHISVLHLASDWSITFLEDYSFDYQPNDVEEIDFDLWLDADVVEETDYYKLFITTESADFRMLQLPSLNQPHTIKRSAGKGIGEMSSLDQLLAQFAEQVPKTRRIEEMDSLHRAWRTIQLPLTVKRDDPHQP